MMEFDSESNTLAFCVPVEAEHAEYHTDFYNSNYAYPSASASYSYSYPVAEDDDFCDIIADLAQAEYGDVFMTGLSAVALPVEENGQDAVPAVSIPVSNVCLATYATKGFEILPAKAIDAAELSEEECLKLAADFEECEDVFNKKAAGEEETTREKIAHEKKMRRFSAVLRLKEKRRLKKQKLVQKSLEIVHSSHPIKRLPLAKAPEKAKNASSARQLAAAGRERVKGKFKNNNTRWVAVTEFLRRTHIDEAALNEYAGMSAPKG